jgi:intracellular multiplication protein IcmO
MAFHGVSVNDDLKPGLIARDIRPFRYRMHDFVGEFGGMVMIFLGVLITIIPFLPVPMVSDLLFGFSGFFYWYINGKVKTYQFRTPVQKGKNEKDEDKGIFFMGCDRESGAGVWFSDSDFRTHILCFGSTGSGKTRFLLGVLYQAMIVGSGVMYVDGKGDNTVWWLVFSFCRRLDRLDDLLVMNYLVGEGSSFDNDPTDFSRLSNTNNPFAFGNGEQLRSLVVGLMRESGGDGDMWKGMASAMMGGLLKCLTYMRDTGEVILSVEKLREHLPLDKIVELSQREDLNEAAIAPIKKYLGELPGYTEEDAIMGQVSQKAYEQHGYRIMQFSEVLADLSDTYGHIFSAPLGEVDYKDLVFNRRILFVMLPALEKDPDALSGLGKLVVAGVRSALAPALGNSLEGSRREVIEQKPTGSDVPFVMILDEYGYYSVKGFAVVAAQARSLGVSVVFAGQDYPSFKKGSEEEAASTVANTNIKICAKLEDPNETLDIIQKRGGEASTAAAEGFEVKDGSSSYSDGMRTRQEKAQRINLRDLVDQKPGQAHVIFGDEIARVQLFYAQPIEVPNARLNHFVMIEPSKQAAIDKINGAFAKLTKIFDDNDEEDKKDKPLDEGVVQLINDMKMAIEYKEDLMNAAVTAAGLMEVRASLKDEIMKEAAGIESTMTEKDVVNDAPELSNDKEEVFNAPTDITAEEIPAIANENIEDEVIQKPNDIIEDNHTLEVMNDENKPSDSVSDIASEYQFEFEELLNEAVISSIEKNNTTPLTNKEKERVQPINQLTEIEKLSGKNKKDAEIKAKESIDMISKRMSYPSETPKKAEQTELVKHLKSLMIKVNEDT